MAEAGETGAVAPAMQLLGSLVAEFILSEANGPSLGMTSGGYTFLQPL